VPDDVGELIAKGYDRVADAYAGLESSDAPWPRLARVRSFAAALADGSHVLDLGCGNPVPATRELCRRHRVTGVDISAQQIRRARANVPDTTFVCADVREAGFPPASFDAIVALYLIDNVPCGAYPELFRRIACWLRPGGRLLLSAEPGDDPGRVYDWLGVPMFINTVPPENVAELLEAASLRVLSVETEPQLEGGREIEFAWFVAERCAPGTPSPGSAS
jgi:cyclopropane fatty-acyl-phospholipid synthase-like methyltransferase